MRKPAASILITVFSLALLPSAPSYAQPRKNVQYGSIELEGQKVSTITPAMVRDSASAFVVAVANQAKVLRDGATPSTSLPALTDREYQYLAGAYLYCSINLGTCKPLLDAMLEADLMDARRSKQAACTRTLAFWQAWLASDMERRHEFHVKTAYINETTRFKSNVRPRYVKCAETVAEEIKGAGSDAEFFRNRYAEESDTYRSLQKAAQFVEEIKQKEPDLLASFGLSGNEVKSKK